MKSVRGTKVRTYKTPWSRRSGTLYAKPLSKEAQARRLAYYGKHTEQLKYLHRSINGDQYA